MSLVIVLRDEAQAEFDDAFDWYESKRAGLGSEFVAEIQKVFDRIAVTPLLHRAMLADIRKRSFGDFPIASIYRPHADRIEVVAVFHTRRDPTVWQGRA